VIAAGFTHAQAKGALHKTKGNIGNAIELLRNQQKNNCS
jgi:translation elongation factor EF-Ts